MLSVEWTNVNREGEVCDYVLRLEDEAQVHTFPVNGSRDSEYIQVTITIKVSIALTNCDLLSTSHPPYHPATPTAYL